MFCENCGKRLEEGSVFCNVCGARQPQSVFCIQCGKRLEPRSRFCNGCGASQLREEPKVTAPLEQEVPEAAEPAVSVIPEPEEPQIPEPVYEEPVSEKPARRKKSKKWLIPAAALVAALAVAAVFLIPALFPKREETVTIYLLTGRTEWTDGVQTSRTVVEYDDLGRPTLFSLDGKMVMECSVDYDRYGNRTEEAFSRTLTYENSEGVPSEQRYQQEHSYDFEYDDDGQIQECTVYHMSSTGQKKDVTLEFTYDDRGNLILVEYVWDQYVSNGNAWDYYEYDEQGRLVQETFCWFEDIGMWHGIEQGAVYASRISRYSYDYDKKGDLDSLCRSGATVTGERAWEYDELEDVEFQVYEEYSLDVRNGHILIEGDDTVLDENGNPATQGDVFDEHGNLIRHESVVRKKPGDSEGEQLVVTEYTYEALELPKSDAERAQRLMEACCLPSDITAYAIHFFGDAMLGWRTRPISMHAISGYVCCYYYLIPNPIC